MDELRKVIILEKLAENIAKKPKRDKYIVPKALGVAAAATALGVVGTVGINRGLQALANKYPKFKMGLTKSKPILFPLLGAVSGYSASRFDRIFREITKKD